MPLTFKKANTSNIPVIAQLAEQIWRKHYLSIITTEQIEYMLTNMYSSEKLLQQINEGHEFVLVYDSEKAIAYSSISTKDKKNYFLHKFYVDMDAHRRGVGSNLFHYLINQLTAPETIELTVNRKNYKAINFYFKMGFIIKEVADFDIGSGYFMNDFVMLKKFV